MSAPSREAHPSLPLPPGAAVIRHGLRDGSWWWSDATYVLHGFGVGEVVPTTELVFSHVHPEDRDAWRATLLGATPAGGHTQLRLRDAAGATRHVLALVHREDDATVTAALIDVSAVVRAEGARVATEQIAAASTSRATIEQAKGVLATVFGRDPEDAFEMLRASSMHTNVSLRHIAGAVVARVASRGTPVAELVDELGAVLPPGARPLDGASEV